jgi:glycosyltransferase involved in cell wall biosynthesis
MQEPILSENEISPLVTVWVMSFNQAEFLSAGLESVLNQTYANIEVILVDDGSSDASREILRRYLDHPLVKFAFLNEENKGYCTMLNQALSMSHGKYIIDFSPDDVLLPERIALQVAFFEQASEDTGAIFSEADYIDDKGNDLGVHFSQGKYGHPIPNGWIFSEVLSRYFIPTPTVMYRKATLKALNGFDPALSYEDFDMLVRMSRNWQICYQPELLTHIRKRKGSLSTQYYRQKGIHLLSTLKICHKAFDLCQDLKDHEALKQRLAYETKHALAGGYFDIAEGFLAIWKKLPSRGGRFYVFQVWAALKLDLSGLHKKWLGYD